MRYIYNKNKMQALPSLFSHLECLECGKVFLTDKLINYCHDCIQPLVARYHLDQSIERPSWSSLDHTSMWTWFPFLPVLEKKNIISLGEGMTKVLSIETWANNIGLKTALLMKDESSNPTGSFKARGMSAAVSKAVEHGVNHFCTPTAGNAGSALAAYAAKARAKSSIFMPVKTPKVFEFDVQLMGAEVHKVEGSIRDAGLAMASYNQNAGAWDVSTLKEPYRLEGKKTMGYELAVQLDYHLPDVIFYPTGGGTGLIGIWKAFQEMKLMGWIHNIPTRMVAVQMSGCAPIVRAWNKALSASEVWEDPSETAANGLRVPKAFGDKLILKAIKESNGFAIAVEENVMLEVLKYFAQKEGQFVSPEGAACLAAIKQALKENLINPNDKICFIQTGSGYKYVENLW